MTDFREKLRRHVQIRGQHAQRDALGQRIPLRVLASYLNMTPEFLSKIRHNKLNT